MQGPSPSCNGERTGEGDNTKFVDESDISAICTLIYVLHSFSDLTLPVRRLA